MKTSIQSTITLIQVLDMETPLYESTFEILYKIVSYAFQTKG